MTMVFWPIPPLGRYLALLGCVSLLCFVSCNPREEGCLDVDASNFDFSADSHNQSACNYPDLYLSVLYAWKDSSFTPGVFYENAIGQPIALTQVSILLSQFQLETDDGMAFSISDLVEWPLRVGDAVEYRDAPDDFTFVDRSSFWYRLGELRRSNVLSGYRFYAGIPDTLTPVVQDSLPDGHILRGSKAQYAPQSGIFAIARFVVARDTIVANRVTLTIYSEPVLFSFGISKDLVQGRNDSLNITIDFGEIFDQVDLDADSVTIVNQVAEGLKTGIEDRN